MAKSSFEEPYNHDLNSLCLILGLVSLALFVLNVSAIGLPPEIFSVQWRTTFLDKVSNRSIGLLFGMGFTMYGVLRSRRLLRRLSSISLVLSIAFGMSCILTIHDGVVLKEQAIKDINFKAFQLIEQLETGKGSNPGEELSESELQEAIQEISRNQKELLENAQADVTKASVVSAGNLFLIGLGMFSFSRFGLKRSHARID